MDVRENLVEIIMFYADFLSQDTIDVIVDRIIAECVTVQECEVGDVVYQTDGVRIYESKIKNVLYDVGHFAFDKDAIGRSVFLTYEEAEAALPQPPKGE